MIYLAGLTVYVLISPAEGFDHANDLLMPDPSFHLPLMVAAHGVAVRIDIHHAVQHKLSIIAAIKREIVFL
jgi:hypothetical protein